MEDNFTLTWEDGTAVVHTEEVICDIEHEILPSETPEFTGVCVEEEEIVEETMEQSSEDVETNENIVYLTNDNVIVMQTAGDPQTFEEQFLQMGEEIVTDQWDESCPEEIVIGSEEAIGSEQNNDEIEIPLPTDQDEYTAARPYPCDFCSRRFRKKANLMNHMVAHQTDRPHGCNLCGVRYIRKCDLMNHLKIHAYIPETDGLEEDDVQQLDESDGEKKRRKFRGRRRITKIKDEYDDDVGASSSSKTYNYVDEDMRLMEEMENNVKSNYIEYQDYENQTIEVRYPITDPRKPFVCQHCGVGFAREKALESHVRIHAGDSPFECQKCGEMFWDVALLKDHVRNKHGGDIEEFDDGDDDDDEDADYSDGEDNKYGTFYCSTCGVSFHRQDNLKRHQRVHVKEEFINDHEFGHICNVCGESFPEALDLLAHAEVHARSTEHRCMICGEIGIDEQAVAAHVQSKHGKNLPPNTCMLCGRSCKDRRTLLKHSWEHSKEKSFACSKCAKTFHNKARLKRHMISHRNKNVTCDVCGEEFADGRSLMNHRHSHNSLTGRQFPCRECGKTFGSRSSQQIHIRIHTGERPYGCRFCWKAFADGGTLRKHERIHTGEKPYACAVCPRAFNQRVVLREHIRSHHSGPDPKYSHSVTPYCCSVCSDMFATSQDLIVHLIHHCDLNTAMRRQPQVGPRKYKRRRKLKPHELELITPSSNNNEENTNTHQEVVEVNTIQYSGCSDDDKIDSPRRRGGGRKAKKNSPKQTVNINDTYNDFYNNSNSTIENINSIVNNNKTKTTKKNNKIKESTFTSRPKMIHTQKTRIPIEPGEDGKIRHKTKTLVTRTQPTDIKTTTTTTSGQERIRPRTKNVSYHILNSERLPLATFQTDIDTINNHQQHHIIKEEIVEEETVLLDHSEAPEVASEQIVETETGPIPINIIKVNKRRGRRQITPECKLIRIVKGGMIISKTKDKHYNDNNDDDDDDKIEPENILPDIDNNKYNINDHDVDPSPLHELAEISMQHAQNIFKCEMCSAVFSDRAKLLDHVPIHI